MPDGAHVLRLNPMTTLEALRITYDLAQRSALGIYEARRDNRTAEYLEQEKALDEISLLMERMENGEVET